MKIKYVKNKDFQIGRLNNLIIIFCIIFIPITLVNGCLFSIKQKIKFNIDIWEYNSSMSYSIQYHFDNENLIIKKIKTLENENSSIIKNRRLNNKEQISIQYFLKTFPLNSFKDKYENYLIEDGEQKKIEIKINDTKKIIYISNFYQKDISNLINLLNQYIDKNFQMANTNHLH